MTNLLGAEIAAGRLVVAPGIYDMLSAKIADAMGFSALYVTGYGVAASHLGLPDAGIATFTDMIGRVERIVRGVRTPVIADADTGYGGLLNVHHTVRAYEQAGVAAIQIEDQEFPKKCGHTPGRRVVPLADAVRRVAVAAEARTTGGMLLIARTDARTTHGLDAAIERANAFAEAGADIVFVESPETVEELAVIPRRVKRPALANMVDGGGRTPVLPTRRLAEMGFGVAIFPALGFLAAAGALARGYRALLSEGSTEPVQGELHPFADLNRLMGFEDVWAFERRHAEEP
jgi:2-methylisocitrate lyase-like PEP mutase family enzyme